ncbi:MAG: hypothetical protein GF320_20520 [Armatimonadia bacterium]|nr:hypothetical protein [Armatimonadia bacterium]
MKIMSAAIGALLLSSAASAIEPVDPDLTPEARELLSYLESVYGQRVLAGQQGGRHAQAALEASGKHPAILGLDLCGWSKTRWDDAYKRNLQGAIDDAIAWHEAGGIVTFSWHWAIPTTENGDYPGTKRDFADIDVDEAVTAGTPTHDAVMEDLRLHADYLQQLADAKVPILWRPLHEIDGGWFWWTDADNPEATAELWRLIFEYLTEARGIHNLIWVYNAGLKCDGVEGKDVAGIERRQRFYPGPEYVDISGIDIYVNDWFGWPDYREDAYQKAFDIMAQVSPGKMLALSECQGLTNPDLMESEGPMWLYVLPWWVDKPGRNAPEWVDRVYNHPLMITRDELPEWGR